MFAGNPLRPGQPDRIGGKSNQDIRLQRCGANPRRFSLSRPELCHPIRFRMRCGRGASRAGIGIGECAESQLVRVGPFIVRWKHPRIHNPRGLIDPINVRDRPLIQAIGPEGMRHFTLQGAISRLRPEFPLFRIENHPSTSSLCHCGSFLTRCIGCRSAHRLRTQNGSSQRCL